MRLEKNARGFLKIDTAYFLAQGERIVFQHSHKEGLIAHHHRSNSGGSWNASQEGKIQRSSKDVMGQVRSEFAGDLDP